MKDLIIKGDYIRNFFTIIIPVALAILVVVQWYYPHCSVCKECGGVEEVVAAAEEVEEAVTVVTVEEPEVEEVVEQPEVNETEETEVNDTTESNESSEETGGLPITGKITFTIDEVTAEDKGGWGKVTKVKYTIKNQKETITPRIVVYGRDENTPSDMMDYVEGEETLAELIAGDSVTTTIVVSITFPEVDTTKTVELELYDDSSASLLPLKSVTKDFKIE